MNIVVAEVVNQLLLAIAEEMGIALKKTSFSPNIKERADCSTAIFDRVGHVVVQAAHIPIHLSSMIGLVEGMAALRGERAVEPGDMFIANDPFTCGGSHLNDIAVAMPVFSGGELIGFVGNVAHHSDVGGRVPGSEAGDNTEIFQDGVRFPLLKVMSRGRLIPDVMDMVVLNSRTPEERHGDFNAQFAANVLGARKLEELHRRFGADVYEEAIASLLAYTEERARSAIRTLPAGEYHARGFLDAIDGTIGPLAIAVRIRVGDGEVHFDFTGTSPQVVSGINATPISLLAGLYYIMRAILDPTLPTNSGFYRPFHVEIPSGSLLNARPPASVAMRFRSVQRAVEIVCAAMAAAIPDRVVAGSRGMWGVIISGFEPDTGKRFVDYEAHVGGGGAKASRDGWDATWSHCSNSSNLPVEVLEAEYPLRVRRYALREDSGGAGKFRGGLGSVREIVPAGAPVRFTLRGDAFRIPPDGLFGGDPGPLAAAYRVKGRRKTALPGILTHALLEPDETLQLLTPGGGGFGSRLERDPLAVLDDVRAEKVSARSAREVYGVVIRDGSVDEMETRALRNEMQAHAATTGTRGDVR